MSSLSGKRCLITGASRGIGLAIAKRFAAEGASCLLVARNLDTLTQAVESLPLAASAVHPHTLYAGDVSHPQTWEHITHDHFINQQKPLDILVNAAGISQNSLLARTEMSSVQDIVATNLTSTICGSRIAMKMMMKQRSGCIINISSLLANKAGAGASVYAATKGGIISLTRALAIEGGRFGIRANVVVPGYIETDMTKYISGVHETIPLKRLGRTDEVADAAAFLAKNDYASNCVLNLDGGLSAT